MVKVLVEVGATGFQVVVVAQSIRRALEIVEDRYPGSDTRVVFPLDPEAFFISDAATRSVGIQLETPESIAG